MSKLHISDKSVKSRFNAKVRYLLLALIAIGIGLAMTGLTKTVTPVTAANNIKARQAPAITHKLVASYYSLKENLNATLMLSNQGLAQPSVRIHLFSKSGAKLDLPAITLSSNEVRAMDLRQSIPAGSAFEEGSLEVNYEGRPLELGGVVALMNPAQSLMFEEELTEPARASETTRLEGVWWRPTGNSEVRVAVSNNSNAAVSVTIQTQGEGQGNSNSKTVTLASHATRVLTTEDHNGNDELSLNSTTGGISINYTGAPGGVVAHGLIQEPSKGFSNVIDFADPQKSKLTRLDGTGLRFGSVGGQQLNQIVVLRNISNAPMTVSGRIPYTLSNGTQATATIQSFQLASGDVKKVNLPSIASTNQITAAGLEFNYTGTIGSVIGSALSYSNDRNQVFRVPLRDAQVQSSSTGTYPWSINDNSSTMVYLKNVTDTAKQFVLIVRFAGGNYVLDEQTIPAWQSVAFDLRKLRDNQIPDGNGNVIPMNVTNGQAHWSARGTASKPMIGRAEQPDISNGMSMTSACGILCSDSFLWAWMTPASISGFIDDTTQFSVFRQMVDGFGNQYTQQYAPNNWSCDNPSVATVNQNGFATAVGVGSSYIRNPFTAFTYTDEGSYCSENSFTAEPTAICAVLPLDFTITTNHSSIKPTGIVSGLAGADPAIPTADTQATITVTTNPPVAGRTVEFSILIDSTDTETLGGHLGHTGTRTLGTFSSVTGVTNQAGEVATTYTSPIFGGIHKVFGKIRYLNPGSDVSKSVSITVKIPGLQPLNPNFGNYTLTGTTNWHPSNHWGTAIAITNLPLIADDYIAMYPTATKLWYNDMSLRYGGKFDINRNRDIPTIWTNASHDEHRVGRNCDVTTSIVPASNRDALIQIFLNNRVQDVHDEVRSGNHWHLRFRTQ